MKKFLPSFILLALIICAQPLFSQDTEGEIALYNALIEQDRNLKNERFKNPEASPIPVADLATFEGLFYYEPDINFKVNAQLTMLEEQVPVTLSTSDGGTLKLTKYGMLTFQLGNKTHTLTVFRDQNLPELADSPGQLFVPFTDKTTGGLTNDNGRYMALSIPEDPNEVELDFNKAFNPYSAYDSQFTSVIPPDENGLEVVVKTGERKYEDR